MYIPPGAKNDKLLEETMGLIDSLQTSEDIIIGGDFNARTSNKQVIPRDLNPHLQPQRTSMDNEISSRGNLLLGLLDISSLVITNGRTRSYTLGNPTFINRNGCSVVDHIITDPKTALNIVDFKDENTAASDHQPITISFSPYPQQTAATSCTNDNNKMIQLKWEPKKAAEFKIAMHKLVLPDINASVEIQYNSIVNSIKESANKVGMAHTNKKKVMATQPYFDKECTALKRKLNQSLKLCKSSGFKDPQLADFLSIKTNF